MAAGLAGVAAGFVASGLGVAMMTGHWYDVLLKGEEVEAQGCCAAVLVERV